MSAYIGDVHRGEATVATSLDELDLLLPAERLTIRIVVSRDAVLPHAGALEAPQRAKRADAERCPSHVRKYGERHVREESLLLSIAGEHSEAFSTSTPPNENAVVSWITMHVGARVARSSVASICGSMTSSGDTSSLLKRRYTP
jgi:hypothetical protein